MEKFDLTVEGLKKYKDELDHLVNFVRPQVTQEIVEAKAQGDLSENADYDAARNKQAEVEGRIVFLKNLIENARIIEHNDSDVVSLGSTVTLKFLDVDMEEEYLIVGPAEADPEAGKISNACKLAQAILTHKEGEVVTVKVDNPYQVEILKISKK